MKRFLADFLIVYGVLLLADRPWCAEVICGVLIVAGLDIRDES